MNKAEIAGWLAACIDSSKAAARKAVGNLFVAVGDASANGEEVRLTGFGAFGSRSGAARAGRNPRTRVAVSVSVSTSPTFKTGKTLKDALQADSGS